MDLLLAILIVFGWFVCSYLATRLTKHTAVKHVGSPWDKFDIRMSRLCSLFGPFYLFEAAIAFYLLRK